MIWVLLCVGVLGYSALLRLHAADDMETAVRLRESAMRREAAAKNAEENARYILAQAHSVNANREATREDRIEYVETLSKHAWPKQ